MNKLINYFVNARELCKCTHQKLVNLVVLAQPEGDVCSAIFSCKNEKYFWTKD